MIKGFLKYLYLGTALLLYPAHSAHAEDFTLHHAIDRAINYSPEIRIADEKTGQATFSVDEARAGYYPTVDAFAQGGREYNNPASGVTAGSGPSNINNSTQTSLTINQSLFNGFQTTEEVGRLRQLVESSEIQKNRVEEQIVLDTVEAYLLTLQNQQSLAEAALFVQTMQGIRDKLLLMVEVGAESEAKLKFLDSRLQAARQEKIRIESALSDALNDLELLIGPFDPFEALHPLSDFVLEDFVIYFDLAQKYNKEIQVNQSDKKALIHQLGSVKGRYYPTLDAVVEVSQSHDVGGEIGKDKNASGMLQVSYKIFDGFARDASKKRVLSQIKELDIRLEKLDRDLNQQIKLLHNQLSSLENEWHSVTQEIESNDELRWLNQEEFELGEGNILELVESEERYFTSHTKKLLTEFDYVFTIYRMKQQIGTLNSAL